MKLILTLLLMVTFAGCSKAPEEAKPVEVKKEAPKADEQPASNKPAAE